MPREPVGPGRRVTVPLAWMGGASVAAWLVASAIGGDEVNPEGFYGMLGPLVSASGTWIAVERTHAAAPERLTAVLIGGFVLKMLFFGAYVAVVLRGLDVRPVPFVVSFTAYFIALYAMEALFLKRLTTGTSRPPSRRR